jgi:hypothetical protein
MQIMTPDNFRTDAYGWLTNQISHMMLGLFAVILYCSLGAHIAGAFPDKWVIWTSVAVSYALIEIIQRGPFWDSVEDFIFVAVYGSGLPVWVVEWTEGGRFAGDIFDLMPWGHFILFHLVAGSVVRLALKDRD